MAGPGFGYTRRVQLVLQLSNEEARRMGNNFIGTEHLLLGLIKEGEGVAAKALESLGIEFSRVRAKVEELVGGKRVSGPDELVPTPRVKRVLELARQEAQKLGHNYLGTEHLLLGLVGEGEGVAAKVLNSLGVDLGKARSQVVQLLHGGQQGGPAKSSRGIANPFGAGATEQPQAGGEALDNFGRDLTDMAEQGELDPVIGRDKEIERVIQILSRRTKNNPVLIGDAGVGKTAIAEGLAQRIVEGRVPETLIDKRLISLDMGAMVAGTKYRGEFEQRMKQMMDEIRKNRDVVLFIDELHTIVGAGGAEGAIDASNILKPALARGDLQAIGATTVDEYRKHIEKDSALERRFQAIMVDEPTVEDTIAILKGLRDRYEAHHRTKITDEAIDAAAILTDRYVTGRFLPDKAIDVMDEAASKVRLKSFTAPPDVKDLKKELEHVRKEKESAVNGQEFEEAARLRDQERELTQQLEQRTEEWKDNQVSGDTVVSAEDIAQVVSSWTGIPVSKLAQEESERLLKLEEVLHQRVVGQDEAVEAIARAVRRARAGLKDPKRPIGSFIFLGPTGVGKTELARALGEALFGDEDSLIRLDMSEYMERHTVSRLVGSPPGYVGHDEGGQLTEAVRRKPYSIVLLDEIEKAHPEVFNVLLQIMEDGRLTDSKGRTVDFRNTVVIMTANVGANLIKNTSLGFRPTEDDGRSYEAMKGKVMDEVKRTFRPEFLNRVDEMVVFHALTREDLNSIVSLMLREVGQRLRGHGLEIEVTPEAKAVLADKGYDPAFGARPLRRTIQRMVEDRLAEMMLEGEFEEGGKVLVDTSGDEGDELTLRRT